MKHNFLILKAAVILTILVFIQNNTYSQDWFLVGSVNSPGATPSINVYDNNIVWIAGGSGTTAKVFRTTDGGYNWATLPTIGISHELSCVWTIGTYTGYVGEGVVNGSANLYKTTDAGQSWISILQTAASNGGHFTGLAFTKQISSIFGLAMATRVYRSTNSGSNWVMINSGANGVSNAQNSLMIIDNLFYGFGLDNGAARIRLTTDNGVSWAIQNINVSGNYTSAIAFHTNKLYGVAATSTSLPMMGRTTDGGNTWNAISICAGVTGTCYLNWVPNTSVVYIIGSNGGVSRSLDNGVTWNLMQTAGVTNITHFDFANINNIIYGYAISSNGSVIKLVDSVLLTLTGVNENNQPIPHEYSLSQNYPNPFNPSTTIKYDVPHNGFVKISIFDMLGNVVSTPVNEMKPAGSYELNWNASNYASGTYFYKMETESFTEFKKMVLIK